MYEQSSGSDGSYLHSIASASDCRHRVESKEMGSVSAVFLGRMLESTGQTHGGETNQLLCTTVK